MSRSPLHSTHATTGGGEERCWPEARGSMPCWMRVGLEHPSVHGARLGSREQQEGRHQSGLQWHTLNAPLSRGWECWAGAVSSSLVAAQRPQSSALVTQQQAPPTCLKKPRRGPLERWSLMGRSPADMAACSTRAANRMRSARRNRVVLWRMGRAPVHAVKTCRVQLPFAWPNSARPAACSSCCESRCSVQHGG
jgi:hypothetical protein